MVRRVRALGAALLVGVGTLAAPAQAQPWVPSCAPIEVIQAAGTGFSHSWHPSARTTLFDDGSSPAHDLQERFGAARVRHYQVKYPATLGRFNAFGARANPSLVADAQSAGDFGPQHFAYYKLGYTDDFSVGGRTGYGYALDWTSQVIDGVLAGR
ncbi:hypothetical protein M5J20_07800 [Corynebacterium sp. TA-R-1]|uniref:Uncharacterized protein n=1 Tax=Corynebacterium stercoris TaxID=2943490 RepID=A0ABT1G230_9CORY|nr:hypothetical protein [Corynebacterium stercoris]MCP1388090.1 hypothetical protein [Corynebacterium stercoris]